MIFGGCEDTVSILYAAIFGAGEACIDLSMPSLITAFAVFLLLVVIAQFAARRIWARLMRSAKPAPDLEEDFPAAETPERSELDRGDPESPVRSSRF